MLKLKLQYFGHLIQRANSLEKTPMLGKIEHRRRGRQRMRWLDGITDSMDPLGLTGLILLSRGLSRVFSFAKDSWDITGLVDPDGGPEPGQVQRWPLP